MANKQLMLPANRAFNSNGLAISGAQAKLYATGTSTPATFYADSGLTVSLGSTITADGAGRFPTAYQNEATAFRFQTLDATGAVLDDIDPFYFGLVQGVDGDPGPTGPQGPAGDLAKVTNRTALAAITGLSGNETRYLIETGHEGTFVFSTINHSTDVTADPNQGVYIAPLSDPTGASGAWVRKFNGKVNVKWFGAIADWNGTAGTDNGAAFTAALNYLNSTAASGTSTFANANLGLYIPAGKYWLNSTTLDIRTNIIIEGDSTGENGGQATFLKWAAGTTGIRLQASNTTGATSSQTQDNTKSSAASIIRNLYLEGSYSGTNAEVYGIQLRARASIRDCWIYNFQGDGIYIVATAGGSPEGNCNNFEIYKVNINGCRNGIYTSGGDVNAGLVIAADCLNNRSWGISDNSFLGNTYIACHTSGNGSGAYQSTNNNAANVFSGCYSESGQPTSAFVYPTVIMGGLHAAGVSGTGSYVRSTVNGTTLDTVRATTANLDNVQINTGLTLESGAQQVIYSSFNGGTYLLSGVNLNMGGSTLPGFIFGNAAGGTIAGYIESTSLNWIYGGDGNTHFALDNTGINLVGAYKVGGTTIINGSGVLQAAGFPALTGDVTTSAGSLATTIAANAVTYAKFQQVAASSLVGNPTGSLANAQGITLGATLTFSGTALQTAAHTGDVTTSANSFATTIAANAVTYAKFQQVAASSLVGNPTGSLANAQGITLAGGLGFSSTTLTINGSITAASSINISGAITGTTLTGSSAVLSSGTGGVGYSTGSGGTVTQLTSRTTGVTINKPTGAITLVSAAGSSTWATFTVTNSTVAATDTVEVVQKSGANLYSLLVTAVAAGSFNVSVSAVSGTATESPVLNFTVTKGVTA